MVTFIEANVIWSGKLCIFHCFDYKDNNNIVVDDLDNLKYNFYQVANATRARCSSENDKLLQFQYQCRIQSSSEEDALAYD
jgi:hypothetical protein